MPYPIAPRVAAMGTGNKPPVQGTDFNPTLFIFEKAVAYWRFETADYNIVDVTERSNDLTFLGSADDPAVAAGKLGQAWDAPGAVDYYYRASTADLQIGAGDFIVATWVRPAGVDTAILSKDDGANFDYRLRVDETGAAHFGTNDDAGEVFTGEGALVVDAWSFIVARVNVAGGAIQLRVNNGTLNSGTYSAVTDGVFTFKVGQALDFFFFDGLIDDTLILKTATPMSSEDFDALCSYIYSSGNGLDLSFIF